MDDKRKGSVNGSVAYFAAPPDSSSSGRRRRVSPSATAARSWRLKAPCCPRRQLTPKALDAFDPAPPRRCLQPPVVHYRFALRHPRPPRKPRALCFRWSRAPDSSVRIRARIQGRFHSTLCLADPSIHVGPLRNPISTSHGRNDRCSRPVPPRGLAPFAESPCRGRRNSPSRRLLLMGLFSSGAIVDRPSAVRCLRKVGDICS